MYPFRSATRMAVGAIALVSLAACADAAFDPVDTPEAATAALSLNPNGPPAPGGLVNVSFGSDHFMVWPWTGKDVAGTTADPLNILFTGDVDVVSLRAALRALDGNRTAYGFPNAYPFNCTWTDANGEMQTAWSGDEGWVANPVQLQCGSYDPLRFHIRFFPAGDQVLAGTHLDLLIPNTPQHQVISWELAEQLVLVDFLRSGLLEPAAPFASVAVGLPGAVHAIPAVIYDGMPASLRAAIGGPATSGGSDVPVPTDGMAKVLNIGTRAAVAPDLTESDFTLPFNQLIPRPFCASGPTDYVLVQGPVAITTSVRVNANGQLQSHNTLRGDLDITPIDIMTGQPSGPAFRAQIWQIDNTGIAGNGAHVESKLARKALPPGVGYLTQHLITGPNGLAKYTSTERCN
jgi:hypothetical protein